MSNFDDQRATAIVQRAIELHMSTGAAVPATESARIMAAEEIVQAALQVEQIKRMWEESEPGITEERVKQLVPSWPAAETILFEANVLVGSTNGDQQEELLSAPAQSGKEREPGGSTESAPPPPGIPSPTVDPEGGDADDSRSDPDRTDEIEPQPVVEAGAAVTRDDPKKDEVWLSAQGDEWEILSYPGGQEAHVRKVATGEETMVPAVFLKTRKMVVLSGKAVQELASEVDQDSTGTFTITGPGGTSDPIPYEADEQQVDQKIASVGLRISSMSETDDEGDDRYADILGQTARRYGPSGMVVPHDLSYQPSSMPDGEHEVGDAEVRRLHLQFNALAARAKFLYDVEEARARGCDLARRLYLRSAKREARKVLAVELGKAVTETAVNEMAEDDEDVRTWTERKQRHAEEAEAWKTHFEINTQNVVVLSRDWTMRDRQVQS